MFSDKDPANKGRDSMEMLRLAVARVSAAGWRVQQVDVTVVTEWPKITPHRDAMRACVGAALGVDAATVSIKGKSNEGLGWIGREEGLACMAVATLIEASS
jgi:2-C-methyl-D-erythritol 2,4-cyclodiphosphate synthase